MKIKLILLLFLVMVISIAQAQTDSLYSQVFSLSPVSPKVDKVNGMVFGIGHIFTDKLPKKVNGLNLEVNPLVPLFLMFQDWERVDNDSLKMTMNGLHLSAGGFSGGVRLNGVGISVYNVSYATNGFSVTAMYNVAKQLNGVHLAGLYNDADTARGLFIAAVNDADDFGGMRIGIKNSSVYAKGLDIALFNLNESQMHGVQIGLFNKAGKCRGLQIGIWNINSKRSLPFINW
jgi:hypothetical protein